jgi:hypothetical protein
MIKTLQRKFIITAMIAVSVLLILLLGGINAFNAWTTENETDSLLSELLISEANPTPERPNNPMGNRGFLSAPPSEDDKISAVFFTVRFDSSGNIMQADTSHISSVSDSDAAELAANIYAVGKESGRAKNFKYMSVSASDGRGRVYLFMDVSSDYYAVFRVAVLSALAGVLCWALMLLLVVVLSKKAIRPIAENIQKQKQFVTDAGHEIKTPLAIILANTDALELHSGESKWSRNIRDQTVRLNGLTQNLLALARSEEGSTLIGTETFSLSASVSDTVRIFKEQMEAKGLTVNEYMPRDIFVCANKGQISQLLSILIDNAVKYSVEGSEISLSLQRTEKKTVLQIENVCAALPRCEPEKLFDRFYRADDARTQSSGGYGIGLSAAKAIAQLYHGAIYAHYEEPDKIVFTVELP